MKRFQVFIAVFAISLGVIIGLLAVGVYLATSQPSQYPSSWAGQMWGGMRDGMGGMMGGGTTATSYYWIIPASLIAIGIISGIGVAFYFAFPEIRTIKESPTTLSVRAEKPTTVQFSSPTTQTSAVVESQTSGNSYELIAKTMTPDEKKVLDVLNDHDGKYLQKYIRNETGLSRLQTHRIVARFVERGIVTVRQVGNTNEVLISDWLKSCNIPKTKTNN